MRTYPPKHELIARFKEVIEHRPFAWFVQGDGLMLSCELVRENYRDAQTRRSSRGEDSQGTCHVETMHHSSQRDTAFMLAGYAVENYLKGLVALKAWDDERQGRPHTLELIRSTSQGHKLGKDLITHDLEQLAESAEFFSLRPELEASDRRLLQQLRAYVEWAGRYPMALVYTQTTTHPGGDVTPLEGFWKITNDADWRLIDDLIARFRSAYCQTATYYTEFDDGKIPPEHKPLGFSSVSR